MQYGRYYSYLLKAQKTTGLGSKPSRKILKMPAPYTGKILNELVKKGLISSKKGSTGPFYQSKEGMSYTVLTIVEAIDGL